MLVEDLATGQVVAQHNAALAHRLRLLPGSALKPFTALILLSHHIVSVRDRLLCPRVLPRYGARFACTHPRPTRPWNIVDALAWSCNSFFLTVAQRLPRHTLVSGLRGFGLPPDLPQSATADVGAMAIGAEAVHVTPWQLLHAYARLLRQRPANANVAVVCQGMRQCVQRGTGAAAAAPGWSVAGKTGTIAETEGGLTHAWFIGDAPARHPRYLVLVAVARGDAATSAAVIAGRIFAAMRTEASAHHPIRFVPGRDPFAAGVSQAGRKPGGIRHGWRRGRLLTVAQQTQDPRASPHIRQLAARPIRLELDTHHTVRAVLVSSPQSLLLTGGPAPETVRGPLQVRWTPAGLVLKTAAGSRPWPGRRLFLAARPFFDVAAGRQTVTLTGRLEIRRLPHGLQLIAEMPLEEYVAGAVSAEAGDMPPAAERAMAVLVRTWALENRGRHRRQGFDFCSTTHCEAWKMHRPLARAVAATRQTQGQVLEYHGRLATIFYSADCGGVTAPGSQFENGARLPYLASHPDPWCRWSPQTNWTTVIPQPTLKALMVKAGWLSLSPARLHLRVVRRDRSGRVLELAVTGNSTRIVRGSDFRFWIDRHLGWNRIKSTLFDIVEEGDAIRFVGHGLGHGAGLCEDGAEGMARAGRDERQILAFYFPGTVIARLNLPADPSFPLKKTSMRSETAPRARPRQAGIWRLQPCPGGGRVSARVLLQPAPHLVETAWTPTPSPGWRYASDGLCRLRFQGEMPPGVLDLCAGMVREAEQRLQVPLRHPLTISVYGSVAGFIRATGQPGWVAAATHGHQIALPPLAVVERHRRLATVLRHEIFHALIDEHRSPAASLCLQEGAVLYFTGEAQRLRTARLQGDARPLSTILAAPRSQAEHRQALAACAARATTLVRQHGDAALRHRLLSVATVQGP